MDVSVTVVLSADDVARGTAQVMQALSAAGLPVLSVTSVPCKEELPPLTRGWQDQMAEKMLANDGDEVLLYEVSDRRIGVRRIQNMQDIIRHGRVPQFAPAGTFGARMARTAEGGYRLFGWLMSTQKQS